MTQKHSQNDPDLIQDQDLHNAQKHDEDQDLDDNKDLYDDEQDHEEQNLNQGVASSPAPGHVRKVSPKTVEQYMGFVKTIRKKYLASLGGSPHERDVSPIDLADFLISQSSTLRPKTVINYKCGLLYWLNTLPSTPDVNHARLVLQVGMPKTGYKGATPNTTATLYSSKSSRRRTFDLKRFGQLLEELTLRSGPSPTQRGSRRAMELMLWLRAGLATGLRPIEWEQAKWHNHEKRELLVRTAKKKMGTNALPTAKGLPIPDYKERIVTVDEPDLLWVEQHMASVKRHLLTGEPFSTYYNNNRIYLWIVSKELFEGKAPFTLYLMRGQFAANMKRYATTEDVAAMMGCAPAVASTYYGKKRYAHSSSFRDDQREEEREALQQAQNRSGTPRFDFNRPAQPAGSGQGKNG